MKRYILTLFIFILFTSCDPPKAPSVDPLSEKDFARGVTQADGKTVKRGTLPTYHPLPLQGPGDFNETWVADSMSCHKPRTFSELTANGETLYKIDSMSNSIARDLGDTCGIGRLELLFVKDYTRYNKVKCDSGFVNYGVGLRLFIRVKHIKKSFPTTLSAVAISCTNQLADAHYRIIAIGTGFDTAILSGFPQTGKFDTASFAAFKVAKHNFDVFISRNPGTLTFPAEIPR